MNLVGRVLADARRICVRSAPRAFPGPHVNWAGEWRWMGHLVSQRGECFQASGQLATGLASSASAKVVGRGDEAPPPPLPGAR